MKERPKVLQSLTYRKRTGCGNVYITISNDSNEEYKEIFCVLGKTGGCASAHMESLARIITEALNYGVPRERIIKHLLGINCPQSGGLNLSCPVAVAEVLKEVGENEKS